MVKFYGWIQCRAPPPPARVPAEAEQAGAYDQEQANQATRDNLDISFRNAGSQDRISPIACTYDYIICVHEVSAVQ